MSIVPREVVAEAPAAWNEQADKFNHWNTLGEDEKLEWVANRVAQWALEQAVTAAHKIAHEKFVYEFYTRDMADSIENAIRAIMAETGGDNAD